LIYIISREYKNGYYTNQLKLNRVTFMIAHYPETFYFLTLLLSNLKNILK